MVGPEVSGSHPFHAADYPFRGMPQRYREGEIVGNLEMRVARLPTLCPLETA